MISLNFKRRTQKVGSRKLQYTNTSVLHGILYTNKILYSNKIYKFNKILIYLQIKKNEKSLLYFTDMDFILI